MIALRAPALSFEGDPFVDGATALRYESDAIVAIEDGRIADFGPASRLAPSLPPETTIVRYPDGLIVPGFIDAHVHFPQLPIVATPGSSLLDWLARHTFVVEQRFADPAFAAAAAEVHLDECLRHGITTAAVYGTVHRASVDAFFAAAQRRDLRMIAGKSMMDRHAPAALLDTAQAAYDDAKALIARWHGRGRLCYAVTPRFAPSSTPAQLDAAGALVREHPDVWMQTHLAETREEVEWVRRLFPEARDYLDVYARHGLLGRRSVFGHGVHLDQAAWQRLFDTGAAIAHCPTSNQFLGSGSFRIDAAKRMPRPVRVALATDVGGGTTLSMLATMGEAYKVARAAGVNVTPAQLLWLATAGAADALDLAGTIGNLAPGAEADLVILDPKATPFLRYRCEFCASIEDLLGVLMFQGDDRAIRATWIRGRLARDRDRAVIAQVARD